MSKPNPYQIHSSKIVYENRWVKIHEDQITHPAGHDGIYAYAEVKNSAVVVAMNERGEIFLSYNFRYPTKGWGWELPGGGGETGEETAQTARRELAEEAGLASDDWKVLGETVVWNGFATEKQASLLARDVYSIERPESDDQDLVTDGQFFSLSKIHEMIAGGEINDNQTLTALYLAELYLNNQETGEK